VAPGPMCTPTRLAAAAALLICGCTLPPAVKAPSDDPADWSVDTSVEYEPVLSNVRWIIPGSTLPPGVTTMAANNNVDIVFFEDRLFLVFRTAESHFASRNAKMYVISSTDLGESWDFEREIALGTDVREPRFLSFGGHLYLHVFEAGTNPLAFEPKHMWRTERRGPADWTDLETFGSDGEVPWCMKVRGGVAYLTSYLGTHYSLTESALELLFSRADGGTSWSPVDPAEPAVYSGGVSEAAFELDEDGTLYAVTRNEDGDSTGFGSHLCIAESGVLAKWSCPSKSDPERYDSPWMIRHGKEIYLLARRDIGGPYDEGKEDLTFAQKKQTYLLDYSNRPKRTSLYKIDKSARKIVRLFDLPSAGDTAFPSARRTGAHTFLVANYSSPLSSPNISWLQGQSSAAGTQIYLVELSFEPVE
jgi:hypothetical protein